MSAFKFYFAKNASIQDPADLAAKAYAMDRTKGDSLAQSISNKITGEWPNMPKWKRASTEELEAFSERGAEYLVLKSEEFEPQTYDGNRTQQRPTEAIAVKKSDISAIFHSPEHNHAAIVIRKGLLDTDSIVLNNITEAGFDAQLKAAGMDHKKRYYLDDPRNTDKVGKLVAGIMDKISPPSI